MPFMVQCGRVLCGRVLCGRVLCGRVLCGRVLGYSGTVVVSGVPHCDGEWP